MLGLLAQYGASQTCEIAGMNLRSLIVGLRDYSREGDKCGGRQMSPSPKETALRRQMSPFPKEAVPLKSAVATVAPLYQVEVAL